MPLIGRRCTHSQIVESVLAKTAGHGRYAGTCIGNAGLSDSIVSHWKKRAKIKIYRQLTPTSNQTSARAHRASRGAGKQELPTRKAYSMRCHNGGRQKCRWRRFGNASRNIKSGPRGSQILSPELTQGDPALVWEIVIFLYCAAAPPRADSCRAPSIHPLYFVSARLRADHPGMYQEMFQGES